MYKRAKRKRKNTQKGGALPLAALLPFAKAALPWLGKAALGGAASFGSSKILGKIFGGKRKKPYVRNKRFYLGGRKPIVRSRRLYLGGGRRKTRKKQRGGFIPSPAFWIAEKIISKAL